MALRAAEQLARCPLFTELPDEDLFALARTAKRRTYPAGSLLFLAGEEPEGLHLVARGRVRIFVVSPETGRELILAVERPYNAVAELPSFDRGPYPANAEAAEDTETLFLPQDEFERVLAERPAIARHLLRTLGRRLRRLVGLIEALSFQEVIHRLAGHLAERAQAGLPFQLETNAEIAARLGTVPELVSRNLSRMQQSGLVTLSGRAVVAAELAELLALARTVGR